MRLLLSLIPFYTVWADKKRKAGPASYVFCNKFKQNKITNTTPGTSYLGGPPCPAQGLSGMRTASDRRHSGTVLALETFFSFWEPEGKSNLMKYNKNDMPLKIRAIYYKSKWPLIIHGNFFFLI